MAARTHVCLRRTNSTSAGCHKELPQWVHLCRQFRPASSTILGTGDALKVALWAYNTHFNRHTRSTETISADLVKNISFIILIFRVWGTNSHPVLYPYLFIDISIQMWHKGSSHVNHQVFSRSSEAWAWDACHFWFRLIHPDY